MAWSGLRCAELNTVNRDYGVPGPIKVWRSSITGAVNIRTFSCNRLPPVSHAITDADSRVGAFSAHSHRALQDSAHVPRLTGHGR